MISFDPIAKAYSEKKELYANPTHLNAAGNHKLGILIAENIVITHRRRLQRIGYKAAS